MRHDRGWGGGEKNAPAASGTLREESFATLRFESERRGAALPKIDTPYNRTHNVTADFEMSWNAVRQAVRGVDGIRQHSVS